MSCEPAAESSSPLPPAPGDRSRQTLQLGLLFGALYFIQGIGEPTEGLIAQPVRSLLDGWHCSESQIGLFGMLLALPWAIKPVFGILSDFVPLWGRRRKSYLVLVNAAALGGFLTLYLMPPQSGQLLWLLAMLLLPTTGVAFADVVVDALMVERGQPLGLTGRLQSIQWACMYGATIATGVIGGFLSERHQQQVGFLICAAVMVPALLLSLFAVREPRAPHAPPKVAAAVRALWQAARTPRVAAVGAFLFLWNFNPFSTNVLYLHMRHGLEFDEQFYGHTLSLQAIASVVACVCYGLYCRRVKLENLIHLSIALGVLSTLGYWAMYDRLSAVFVALGVGFVYMTATLIQLDLSARVCPPETAGTVFALLMALSNLGTSLSTGLGGILYEQGLRTWSSRFVAFNVLVAVGAAFTAGCWLLVPVLKRQTTGEPLRG